MSARSTAKTGRTTPAKGGRRTAERDLDTERRILDAAHVVFVRRGTAGARMQEIADEARVNKALLHYYFRSKDRLAEAVFHRVARGLFARLAQILTSERDLDELVRAIVALYIDQLSETPYAPAYIISEVSHHPERASQFVAMLRQAGAHPMQALNVLQAKIDARVRAGAMRPIPARQFFVNLVSLCVFPFAARPLLCAVLDLDAEGFADFIRQRRAQLPEFFLEALRP
jgi:TetR/AcrR family transcriptional regulator